MDFKEASAYLCTTTGCGMMAAKQALQHTKGDVYFAEGYLRYQGLAVCIRRSGMTAEEAYNEWVASKASAHADQLEKQNGDRPKVC